jgi:putative membrane protein
MYLTGAIGFVFFPDFFLPFTPFTLLFTCFVFLIYQPLQETNYLFWFFIIALIGFASEVIGVATGMVFGAYHYGETLGIKFLDVPLTISLNWALLVGAAIAVSSGITNVRWLLALMSALIVTAIDLLLEQLAPHLNFWSFNGGKAGWHNYIGWLLVSFSAAYLAAPVLRYGHFKVALLILILQIYFFGMIYLLN